MERRLQSTQKLRLGTKGVNKSLVYFVDSMFNTQGKNTGNNGNECEILVYGLSQAQE